MLRPTCVSMWCLNSPRYVCFHVPHASQRPAASPSSRPSPISVRPRRPGGPPLPRAAPAPVGTPRRVRAGVSDHTTRSRTWPCPPGAARRCPRCPTDRTHGADDKRKKVEEKLVESLKEGPRAKKNNKCLRPVMVEVSALGGLKPK